MRYLVGSVTACVVVALLFTPGTTSAADGPFDDVPSDHLFVDEITWLAGEGITLGCNPPDNTLFCPDDPVTRGQMAAFLVRGLHLDAGSGSFDDTAGHVFEDDISALAAACITLGCNPPDNTLFCPDNPVTRGQMAAFLVRGLHLDAGSGSFDDTAGHVFEDDISALAAVRITLGCNPPDNTLFCPDNPVTRAQMAAFLHRGLEDDPPPTTTTTTTPPTTTTAPTTTTPPTTTTAPTTTMPGTGPEITTTALPPLSVFEAYETTLQASGGEGPYTWDVEGLPTGLVFNADTATISNDPDYADVISTAATDITVTVTDDLNNSTSVVLTLDPVDITSVDAGNYHSCALDEEGAAWCWGENESGQLGEGGLALGSTLPVNVLGDHEFSSITAGGEHTCALDVEGAAWCWGRNHNGQLGDNNLGVNSTTPVRVAGGHTFSQLATSFAYTCGIDTDDIVWCWGSDNLGQLGLGGDGAPVPVPTMVGDGDPFTAATVVTGGSHACALKDSGDAYCWGYNANGQLGIGPDTSIHTLPTLVVGDHTFTSLVNGQNHTCGIDDAGATWCWGENAAGQLGLGDYSPNHNVPEQLTDGPEFTRIIAETGHYTCGIDLNDAAWCWGSNNFGQLGIGQIGGSNPPNPVPVVGDHNFGAMSLGEFHACGTDGENVVRCWGGNFTAQLGQGTEGFGTEVTRPEPVHRGTAPATGPGPLRLNTSALPDFHALVSYEEQLWAEGGSGEYLWQAEGLPDGLVLDESTGLIANDPTNPVIRDASPFPVVDVTVTDTRNPDESVTETLFLEMVGVTQLNSGWGHTCAVTSEATAFCWGRNNTGQIGNGIVGGDGPDGDASLPAPVLNTEGTGPLTDVAEVVGGDGHSCARTNAGTAYCWGASFDGRLGNGSIDPQPQPLPQQVRNSDDSGPLTDVVDIVTGSQFGCAITADGVLHCWGNSSQGKLGNGETNGFQPLPQPVRNPTATGPLTDVTEVSAGSSHACAVSAGTTYCWGGNFGGKLGNGESTASEPIPVEVRNPENTGPLADVSGLSPGANHTCARSGGDAFCWGGNSTGQLGRGSSVGNPLLPGPVRNPDDTGALVGIATIASADNHVCAIANGGATYCWGNNSEGQLGNGENGVPVNPLPQEVLNGDGSAPLPTPEDLSGGNAHTCVLTTTRVVQCFGGNWDHQLGNGDTTDPEPLPVGLHPGDG
ncbi:MAG: hypothetical protein GEU79_07675 [Acidimicrobiia bacterium]|nr:hypothetical protein [Acidimicrobiia bacterium]